VIEAAEHTRFIEKPEQFNAQFHAHLRRGA